MWRTGKAKRPRMILLREEWLEARGKSFAKTVAGWPTGSSDPCFDKRTETKRAIAVTGYLASFGRSGDDSRTLPCPRAYSLIKLAIQELGNERMNLNPIIGLAAIHAESGQRKKEIPHELRGLSLMGHGKFYANLGKHPAQDDEPLTP